MKLGEQMMVNPSLKVHQSLQQPSWRKMGLIACVVYQSRVVNLCEGCILFS